MRLRPAALIFACALAAAGFPKDTPVAHRLLAEAREHCDIIRDPETKAARLAELAEAWRPIDKTASLSCLEDAAKTISSNPNSNAWQPILRTWTKLDPDAGFQEALTVRSTDRIGEVIAHIAEQDLAKAEADLAQVPDKLRQAAAESAVHELASSNETLCAPLIQGATNVNIDALYNIVAREVEDPQLSLQAARRSGKNESGALLAAVRKLAQNDPAAAHGIVQEISDAGDRAVALAVCASAFSVSNQDAAKQCAVEAIQLYNQSSPDWNSRPILFLKMEPSLGGIDSPEIRDFIQRFCSFVDNHFTNEGGDDADQSRWLIVCADAWSRLDLEKARTYADHALDLDPTAGLHGGVDNVYISSSYRRFIDEVSTQDAEAAARYILAARTSNTAAYSVSVRSIIEDLEPDYKDQARAIAKQLHGDFPNLAEIVMDLDVTTPDAAADGLLRLESDSIDQDEFHDDAYQFVDVLIQADPYRAARTVINMESAAHRVPLLSHIIVAVNQSNPELAKSLFDKASTDAQSNMTSEQKAQADTALATAAFALGQ